MVVILGILATLVLPMFSSAADEARESTLRNDLRYLRTQIQVYRAQHGGIAPGYPGGDPTAAPTLEAFTQQMTLYSDAAGNTSATPSAVYQFGPYLKKVPANAITGNAEIKLLANGASFPTEPSGSEGWVYKPANGQIAANVEGADRTGINYFDY